MNERNTVFQSRKDSVNCFIKTTKQYSRLEPICPNVYAPTENYARIRSAPNKIVRQLTILF